MRLRVIDRGKERFDRERRISERKQDCKIKNKERERERERERGKRKREEERV